MPECAAANVRGVSSSLEGRLLVSRPDLYDPNFDGTISLLLEHNEAGAFGIVLNRPSGLSVEDPFPRWAEVASTPSFIFAGGPVERNGLIALGRSATAGSLPLGLHTVDLDEQVELARGAGIEEVRLFAGYAGWSGGQLEGELASKAWWLADATLDDVFCTDPDQLWTRVLRRSGGELQWYAHFPTDASLN
ncbi:MAG: putative transcriptional regulator [Acidimicrobiales bacterium]